MGIMSGSDYQLGVHVRAFDEASSTLGKVGAKIDQFAAKLADVGKKLSLIGIGIGAAFGGAVKAAMSFETAMAEVSTLVDTSTVDMKKLGKSILDLSTETGESADVLASALYQAISAGVEAGEAMQFLGVSARAAVAGCTDTQTAVDGLTTVINAFELETSDAQVVADKMFAAVKAGKTTFRELSAYMFQVGPAANAAGVGLDEVLASISTLTASGTPTAQAATQIRAALVGLQRPSTEMDAIFQRLGYSNAQAAIEARGFGFAISAVAKAANGDNGAMQKLLGSVEAVQAAQIIAGSGAEKFAGDLQSQNDAVGVAQEAYEKMAQTLDRQMKRMGAQLQKIAVIVGEQLLPKIEELVDGLEPILDYITKIIESPLGKWFIDVGAKAAPLLTAVGFLLQALPGLAQVGKWLGLGGGAGAGAGTAEAAAAGGAEAVAGGGAGIAAKAIPWLGVPIELGTQLVRGYGRQKEANTMGFGEKLKFGVGGAIETGLGAMLPGGAPLARQLVDRALPREWGGHRPTVIQTVLNLDGQEVARNEHVVNGQREVARQEFESANRSVGYSR